MTTTTDLFDEAFVFDGASYNHDIMTAMENPLAPLPIARQKPLLSAGGPQPHKWVVFGDYPAKVHLMTELADAAADRSCDDACRRRVAAVVPNLRKVVNNPADGDARMAVLNELSQNATGNASNESAQGYKTFSDRAIRLLNCLGQKQCPPNVPGWWQPQPTADAPPITPSPNINHHTAAADNSPYPPHHQHTHHMHQPIWGYGAAAYSQPSPIHHNHHHTHHHHHTQPPPAYFTPPTAAQHPSPTPGVLDKMVQLAREVPKGVGLGLNVLTDFTKDMTNAVMGDIGELSEGSILTFSLYLTTQNEIDKLEAWSKDGELEYDAVQGKWHEKGASTKHVTLNETNINLLKAVCTGHGPWSLYRQFPIKKAAMQYGFSGISHVQETSRWVFNFIPAGKAQKDGKTTHASSGGGTCGGTIPFDTAPDVSDLANTSWATLSIKDKEKIFDDFLKKKNGVCAAALWYSHKVRDEIQKVVQIILPSKDAAAKIRQIEAHLLNFSSDSIKKIPGDIRCIVALCLLGNDDLGVKEKLLNSLPMFLRIEHCDIFRQCGRTTFNRKDLEPATSDLVTLADEEVVRVPYTKMKDIVSVFRDTNTTRHEYLTSLYDTLIEDHKEYMVDSGDITTKIASNMCFLSLSTNHVEVGHLMKVMFTPYAGPERLQPAYEVFFADKVSWSDCKKFRQHVIKIACARCCKFETSVREAQANCDEIINRLQNISGGAARVTHPCTQEIVDSTKPVLHENEHFSRWCDNIRMLHWNFKLATELSTNGEVRQHVIELIEMLKYGYFVAELCGHTNDSAVPANTTTRTSPTRVLSKATATESIIIKAASQKIYELFSKIEQVTA